MFDLEQAITEWRGQMQAGGIKSPVLLEELESHLREDVDRQISSGINTTLAFEAAVRRIGRAEALKNEFRNTDNSIIARLVQLMGLACAAIGGIFSLWLMANLFHHEMGWTAKLLGLAGVASIILSWRHGHRLLPVIGNRWIRSVIGTTCCVAGIGAVLLFIQFFPMFFDLKSSEIRVGQLLVSFLWIWAIMAILGGIGYGLESAARRHAETLAK